MRFRSTLICSFLVFFALALPSISSPAFGQAIPQFSTVEPHQYDSINLATLGIQLNVPIRTKAGHIPYFYRLVGASQVNDLTLIGGHYFQLAPGLTGGEAHVPQTAGYTQTRTCIARGLPPGEQFSGFYVIDASGTTHQFGFVVGTGNNNACPTTELNEGYATDNSGLYLIYNYNNGSPIYTLYDASGDVSTISARGNDVSFSALTDPNGNTISATTDTLGQTAMTIAGSFKTPPETLTWTDAANRNETVTLTASTYTIYTAFGCPADAPAGSGYILTSISFPDNSTMGFSWEKNQLNSSDYTGRIGSITLPTGGTISYAYSGGTNGINCADGTPATLTRTTPDGSWVYTHVPTSSTTSTTTVTDPIGNNTIYTFLGSPLGTSGIWPLETERQVYNGSVSPSNLMETVITCYNNTSSSPSNCNLSTVGYANISEKDAYTTYPGITGYSAVKTAYDAYGNVTDVKAFDFNATSPTYEKQIVYGSGSPSSQTCSSFGIVTNDKPCSITLLDSQHNNAVLSQTWNKYDSNGNLLQTWNLASGSGSSGTYLSKQYTYDSQGVVQTMTDVNLQVMNYTTTSCNLQQHVRHQ